MHAIELLKWHMAMGADEFIMPAPIDHFIPTPTPTIASHTPNPLSLAPQAMADITSKEAHSAIHDTIKECTDLTMLDKTLQNFTGLSIKRTATHTLFLQGNVNSDILLISDVPGSDDDASGQLFSGAAGTLLDKAFSHINLTRNNIAYMPSVFWRPPGNRRPTKEEISACTPFVKHAIALFAPKLILFVGALGYNALHTEQATINTLRGTSRHYNYIYNDKEQKCPCFFIQHPAILLKNTNQKAVFWKNLLTLQEIIRDNNIT